ncbi:unnamed protein product, partial [Allacma fusca]
MPSRYFNFLQGGTDALGKSFGMKVLLKLFDSDCVAGLDLIPVE